MRFCCDIFEWWDKTPYGNGEVGVSKGEVALHPPPPPPKKKSPEYATGGKKRREQMMNDIDIQQQEREKQNI